MVNWNTASTSSDSGQQASQRASSSQTISAPASSSTSELGVSRSPTSYTNRYAPYSTPRSPPFPESRNKRHAFTDTSAIASKNRSTLAPIYSKSRPSYNSPDLLLPPVNELSSGRPLSATESRALLHRLRADDVAKQPSLPSPSPPLTTALSQQATLLDQDMRRRSEILLAGGCATEVRTSTA